MTGFDTYSSRDRFFIGVDIGKINDPTAIAVVATRAEMRPVYRVGHLERLPLGTVYPQIVAHVRDLMRRSIFAHGRTELVVDQTGCGAPVCDLFEDQSLLPQRITITGGLINEEAEGPSRHWRISKQSLVSRLDAALADRRLHILAKLPEAAALVNELQHFEQWQTDSARWRYGARADGKQHDDLVIALALSVWAAERDNRGIGVWMRLAYDDHVGPRPDDMVPGPGEMAVRLNEDLIARTRQKVMGPGWVIVDEGEAVELREFIF